MIPKIIHYCWFGDKALPKTDQLCIESWKENFPDWEIMLWNETTFTHTNEFLERMILEKKWGLYTEYVRFWALNHFGGIYFDTDVEVIKSFDSLLDDSYFLGFEKPGQVNIAVIGSVKGHPFNTKMLRYYEGFRFDDQIKWSVGITGPCIREMVDITDKNERIEFMANSFIYPVEYFYSLPYEEADILEKKKYLTSNSLAIHYWNATWVDEWSLLWAGRKKTGWKIIMKKILANPFQGATYYRNVFFHLKAQLKGYN